MNRCRLLIMAFAVAFWGFTNQYAAVRQPPVVCASSNKIPAEIVELAAIDDMKLFCNVVNSASAQHVVVVAFDLDQVVMQPETRVGSDPWFTMVRKRAEAQISSDAFLNTSFHQYGSFMAL
jgi:hypothetical protein